MFRALLSLTLAFGLAVPSAAASPEMEPVSEFESTSSAAVGETTWQSLLGHDVVVSAYDKGPIYAGRLHAVGEHTVVLVYDDGRVVEIVKAEVQEVKLDDSPAPKTAPPPANPQAPSAAPPPSEPPADAEAEPEPEQKKRGKPTRVPGNGKLFFGGIVTIIGGLGLTIGGGLMIRDAKRKQADFAVDGVEESDKARRRAKAERIAGTAFVIVGPVAMAAGAIVLAVAIVRRKKARDANVSVRGGWLPGGGGVELVGRF